MKPHWLKMIGKSSDSDTLTDSEFLAEVRVAQPTPYPILRIIISHTVYHHISYSVSSLTSGAGQRDKAESTYQSVHQKLVPHFFLINMVVGRKCSSGVIVCVVASLKGMIVTHKYEI